MTNGIKQVSRIGLGTVQFGLDYGISNNKGQNSLEEVRQILAEAKQLGLNMLDTSPNYGNSEEVLGESLTGEKKHFNIVTKTPIFDKLPITQKTSDLLNEYYEKSLAQLGYDKLYGLLVHHAENLLAPGGEYLVQALTKLKANGLVEKIGVSVYNAEQIDKILDLFRPDIVQLPINLFDQRLINSGHLKKLKNTGVEIHARSIFLQGLLLMPSESIPKYFEPIKTELDKYYLYLKENGITPQEAALGFVKNIEELDYIILGVNGVDHLKENIEAFTKNININFERFAISNEKFICPTLWEVQ